VYQGSTQRRPGCAVGALVIAEEGDGRALVGLQRVEAAKHQSEGQRQDQDGDAVQAVFVADEFDNHPDQRHQQEQGDQQHQAAIGRVGFAFLCAIQFGCGHDIPSHAIKVISL
jgi:hypothetical protein